MVVLPYTSASQSGVPMTVYSFCKPVIASNIAGFSEVIDHMKTGILVDDLSEQGFASSIGTLLANDGLMREMEENIRMKYSNGDFSWPVIADQTAKFYKDQIESNYKNGPQTLRIFIQILFLQVHTVFVNLKMSIMERIKFQLLYLICYFSIFWFDQ
jgi:hypothetical protein